MSAAAADRDPQRQSVVLSGRLVTALVVAAVLGLAIYLTPPHLGSLGPDDVQLWVATRVAWVTTALTLVTVIAVRFVRRRR